MARAARIEIFRYLLGLDHILLSCRVSGKSTPVDRQTWRICPSEAGTQTFSELPNLGITFDR